MKRLGLLRHAKSQDGDQIGRDYDRELNAKGRRAARTMGSYLANCTPHFDALVASPARRVQQTLESALEAMGDAAPRLREEDRRLYLATAETLTEVAMEKGGDRQALLLVAHNPGLEDFVLDRVPEGAENPLREIVVTKFPTGAFALMEFDIEDWSELGDAQGRLIALIRPRDLDPTLGPEMMD